jgi:hypothetical protein
MVAADEEMVVALHEEAEVATCEEAGTAMGMSFPRGITMTALTSQMGSKRGIRTPLQHSQ